MYLSRGCVMPGGVAGWRNAFAAQRRLGPLLLVAALAGCGFEPLYGRHSAEDDAALASIRVAPIAERRGQLLEIALRDGFNPAGIRAEPAYLLQVNLMESVGDSAIRSDGTTSRQTLNLFAGLTLSDMKTGKLLFEARSRSINSYDVAENEYSVVVARDSAEKRAVRELGDDIRARLTMFFRQKTPGS